MIHQCAVLSSEILMVQIFVNGQFHLLGTEVFILKLKLNV